LCELCLYIGSNIGLASLHLLCNVFKHKANVLACLESLNLSRNAMGPEGVSYLKKTLYHFTPSDRVSDTPITVPRLHTIDVSSELVYMYACIYEWMFIY